MKKDAGEVEFEGLYCTMAIGSPAPGIAVVRIAGSDVGEFGKSPMQELNRHLEDGALLELFIDARDTDGASIEVSNEWAQWLHANRARFEHISMLTGSRFIQITAEFVRRFAELEVMRIYSDTSAFDEAVTSSIARARQAG